MKKRGFLFSKKPILGEVDYPDSMRVLQASTKNMAIFMMNYLRQDRYLHLFRNLKINTF